MVSSGISVIEFASVYSEKTHPKNLMIMLIIITTNRLVNEKRDVGILNAFLKSTETRDELSTTFNPK